MGLSINNRKCKGYIILSFDEIPKTCGDCQLFKNTYTYDEDAFWGDGISHYCPYGGAIFGCLKERPKNCPIITPENRAEKLR